MSKRRGEGNKKAARDGAAFTLNGKNLVFFPLGRHESVVLSAGASVPQEIGYSSITGATSSVFERVSKFCHFTPQEAEEILFLPRSKAVLLIIAHLAELVEGVEEFSEPGDYHVLAAAQQYIAKLKLGLFHDQQSSFFVHSVADIGFDVPASWCDLGRLDSTGNAGSSCLNHWGAPKVG